VNVDFFFSLKPELDSYTYVHTPASYEQRSNKKILVRTELYCPLRLVKVCINILSIELLVCHAISRNYRVTL
jgi:hypothetical protein